MAPQPIHGVGGVAELSYGMIYTTNKKSALRSPFRSSDGGAYFVNPGGAVNITGGGVTYSYGRSPSTVYDINGACYIIATGYPTDVGYSIPNSYGIFFYIKKISTFALRGSTASASMRTSLTRMVTSTSAMVWIRIPTGNLSPDRRDSLNGYFTNQYGYIAYDDYGVQYSYG